MEQPVQEMYERYLSRSDLRPASVDIKRRACRFFVQWFGDLPVGRVSSATALDYRSMLGKGRSAVSVNGYLNNFRAFWSWLHQHGYIASDPFALVGPVEVDEQPPRETFTPTELARMMTVATPLEQIQVCLGLLGCRRGEMQAIQVRDLRLNEDPAYILLSRKTDSRTTLAWGTKGRKPRYIPLPPAMAFDGRIVPLRRRIDERVTELADEPEAYLCVDPERIRRRLMGQRTWDELRDLDGNHPRAFRSLQRRAGLRQTRRYHELRAAFVTAMLDQVDAARVADMVGHANVNQTRKYDRKKRQEQLREAAKIAAFTYVTKVS